MNNWKNQERGGKQMKNKKNVIIVIAIIVIVAIGFGIFKISTSYLFNENGKIEDGHAQLINHIKSIENDAERKNQIDYSLSQNLINQTEADELY